MSNHPGRQSTFGRAHRRPVMAAMNYLGEQPNRPLFHTSDPRQSRMNIESHIVPVHDARQLAGPSIDQQGFLLIEQELPDIDYQDQEARDGVYLTLLQDLVKESLNASKVVSDTSILRLSRAGASQVPVLTVHSDYTPASARRLLEESWDQEKSREEGLALTRALIEQSLDCPSESTRRYGRVVAVNAWRPISMPPHDYPLALCERSSLATDDVVIADFIEELSNGEAYRSELSLCQFSSDHTWYHVSDMRPDEVLLFLGFDFADPSRCGVMHSAFLDPECPPDVPGRSSVEVRLFAFFDA